MTDTCIQLKSVWHQYGQAMRSDWSLKDIHFRLGNGELIGLLGPSGCGKTTLLRLIAGFEKPSKGKILINGVEVANDQVVLPPEKRGIGMVFQDYALFPHLNAWNNVCFGLRKNQDMGRALWLLEMLGLEELRYRFPHELSGGQRQRLALARALAPGTSIVLLDEPFSSLDVEVRLRLRSELPSVLKSCGASGILVTHDPQEALAICDRVAVLKNGVIHQCDEPYLLVQKPSTPFVGRFVLQRNVIPIKVSHKGCFTPIGPVDLPVESYSLSPMELMVDDQSFLVEKDLHGEGIILGKEFLGGYWLLKVQIENLVLRVRHSLEIPFQTGERCRVNFRTGCKGVIFPGSIPCLF